MNLRIGNIKIKYGLMLAPMAGVTDYAFRKVCREAGADWTVSEMISAKALCYEQLSSKNSGKGLKTAPLARIYPDEKQMSIQIFGSEPSFMAEAAALLESGEYNGCLSCNPPAAIDINMGCPVHKIVSNGEGSALMKNPELAGRIAEAVSSALKKTPLTVKIRAGWSADAKNALEVAKALEAGGASLICVHGRTREQMYQPGVDLDIIAAVKDSVKIPVVGNGDIYTPEDAVRMLSYTGCDGIMVARGALGNPWLFTNIINRLENRPYYDVDLSQRINTALYHIALIKECKGEHTAAAEAKKHAAWYIKGMKNSAALRERIMKSESYSEIADTLRSIADAYR